MRQPFNFAGQRAGTAKRLQLFREAHQISARLGELLGILLFGQCRRLFLEPHFLDFGACRIEFLLDRKPRLLAAAQLGAHRFQTVARRRERLLCGAARAKLLLQRLLDRRPVDFLAFR